MNKFVRGVSQSVIKIFKQHNHIIRSKQRQQIRIALVLFFGNDYRNR
ncbi:MAG: hypothetical protein LBH00_01465 [Planctomycetaceae bacterium]|nr:hypothetical protein [Planctomycetaceae bacterium]